GLKELEPMLQRLSAIVRKELITMLRDPRARLSLIIPPIIQLFVFSSAATMEVKNIAVAVVDLDRGPYALDVQQRLGGSRSFTRLPRYASVAAARGALEREQVIGILVLPSPFSADLSAGRQATLYLLIVTLLYGVPFRGNLLVFYAAILTFAAACAGVGLFISSLVHTQQQAFLGAFAVLLPFALLSGFATPVENMPWWLQFV